MSSSKQNSSEAELKRASQASFFSFLNLTMLPVIGFITLCIIYKKTTHQKIDHYYALLGIKINLYAAAALILVTALMIFFGGFDSPWTWVYVISYFVFVHALFILFATWVMVRSWTGQKLSRSFLSK